MPAACWAARPATAPRLGMFLVEPDQQSTLLARAQTAISRYQTMRQSSAGPHRSASPAASCTTTAPGAP